VAEEKLRLGGMALRNGLLLHGPTHWSAAVRTAEGDIKVASGRKPRVTAFDAVPGARGVVRLYEAMLVIPLVKRGLPEARMPFQDGKVIAGAVAAGLAGVGIRAATRRSALGEVASAGLSLAPSLLALRGGELAAYHGVEHKAIAAYEQGQPDAADAAKEHERCGSHLVAPMLAANLAGVALLRKVSERPSPVAAGAVGLASIAAAVEVFAWSERHPDTRTARLLRVPGYELQRAIGTREPDERQLEVGRAALDEILRVEGAA
jgi:uncharacterized protein YqhQ